MSLINDALKQIKQTRQQNPPPPPPALSPVESRPPEGFGLLAPGLIVLLLAGTAIFVGVSLSRSTPVAARAAAVKTQPMPVNPPSARPLQSVNVTSTVTQQMERVSAALPATNTAPSGSTAAVMVSPKSTELKLQGILFAATRPCAIVNGRTVFAGDQVNGFRVTMISRDRVTLQNQLETRVLSLNPQ